MGDFKQHAAEEREFAPRHISDRNARYGFVLFVSYLVLYSVFMLINTFQPAWMDFVPAAGVNLAIWYGFGLIIAALVLALIYAWLCRATAADREQQGRSS